MRYLVMMLLLVGFSAPSAWARPPRSMPPEVRAQRILEASDVNEDGLISVDEAPQWLLMRFPKADINKDRALDLQELLIMFDVRERPGTGDGNNGGDSTTPTDGGSGSGSGNSEDHECDGRQRGPVPVI